MNSQKPFFIDDLTAKHSNDFKLVEKLNKIQKKYADAVRLQTCNAVIMKIKYDKKICTK